MGLVFQWDHEKAKQNFAKHRVSFEDASTAFADPLSITIPDPEHSRGEDRYILIGETFKGKLTVVCHTERGSRIRIISARLASMHERRTYEESKSSGR